MTDVPQTGAPSETTQAAGIRSPRIERGRIAEELETYLCDALLSGRYRAGQRLSPVALAKEFGISPMPVREALVALNQVGLVEVAPRRGFRVASLSWRDIEDAFAVQAFISGRLAEYAAATIGPGEIAHLRQLQEAIESTAASDQADAPARIEELNYEFHRTINLVSDASYLRRSLRVATSVMPRQLHALIPGWIEATATEHTQIIDALAAHDSAIAGELSEAHVRRAGALVLGKIAQGKSWEQTGPTVNSSDPPRSSEARAG